MDLKQFVDSMPLNKFLELERYVKARRMCSSSEDEYGLVPSEVALLEAHYNITAVDRLRVRRGIGLIEAATIVKRHPKYRAVR